MHFRVLILLIHYDDDILFILHLLMGIHYSDDNVVYCVDDIYSFDIIPLLVLLLLSVLLR